MMRFEEMIEGIGSNNEVPERVWKKLDHVLDDLPDYEESPALRLRGRRYAAAAAVTAAMGAALCVSNPALAAKIPFIGRIFEEIENGVPFSGNYSEKAGALTQAEDKGEKENQHTASSFVKTDAGITFTASEVYCDGLSVFLTAQIEVEQGGLENLPGHYINGGYDTAEMMYLRGEWNLTGGGEQSLSNDNLEGRVIDDNTFVGMLKLNLEDYKSEDGELSLRLSSIGWDDVTMADAEDISESYRIEGQWDFDIPFSVDTELVKEIGVGQESEGYTLEKVFISPYQVVTYVDVPHEEREITREEYEALMTEKTGGTEDRGITYEEYVEQAGKIYPFWNTVICNQDGEMLFSNPEDVGKTVAAVDGKDISVLNIFVFDDADADLEVEKSRLDNGTVDMKRAKDLAVISAEIEVK